MVSADLESIVRAALALVDENVPAEFDQADGRAMLAVAAIRHGANLLAGEFELAAAGRWSLTRILGRQITESWLWANALILDPAMAFDRMMLADAKQQYLREKGYKKIWEKLESRRLGGIDLQDPASVPTVGQQANLSLLAEDVQRLREARGLRGGIAIVSHELQYRWESAQDVHVSFDLLCRYVVATDTDFTVLAEPGTDDVNSFRGPESLERDASLITDVVGVYLHANGRADRVTHVREQAPGLSEDGR